jgi:hypothetical protein
MEAKNKRPGNPNFRKGGPSPNPKGRHVGKKDNSIKGKLTRFVAKNITPQALQKLYSKLKPREKLVFLIDVLPYVTPRHSSMTMKGQLSSLSDQSLQELYKQIVGDSDFEDTEDATFEETPLQLPGPDKITVNGQQ